MLNSVPHQTLSQDLHYVTIHIYSSLTTRLKGFEILWIFQRLQRLSGMLLFNIEKEIFVWAIIFPYLAENFDFTIDIYIVWVIFFVVLLFTNETKLWIVSTAQFVFLVLINSMSKTNSTAPIVSTCLHLYLSNFAHCWL